MKRKTTQPSRIWAGFPADGNWRELHNVFRNTYGDILFTLDGGEVWQFTPKEPTKKTPCSNEVASLTLGIGRKHYPQTDFVSLKESPRFIAGSIRIFPAMRQDEQAEILDRIEATQKEMMPLLKGVPPLVESSKEATIDAMGEFWRILYEGFTPIQKAVCDAMIKTKNRVREASKMLIIDGWKKVSPSSVSRILKEIDQSFKNAGKPNPFSSRKYNRSRPVVETTYKKQKVDPNDEESVEIVPSRHGGYGSK